MFEYERLKHNSLFSIIKRNNIWGNKITVFVHNTQSLSKHIDDIVSDDRIINNSITGFTETQIKPSGSTCKMETLNFFNINFNNNVNKFLSLGYGCRNKNKFDANGVSIFSFKKHAFADIVFTLMLVYRKQSMLMQVFSQMFQYLVATCSIDIIAGDFNYDLLKVLENELLDIFTDHVQMVKKPTYIWIFDRSCQYQESLIDEFFTNATVKNRW